MNTESHSSSFDGIKRILPFIAIIFSIFGLAHYFIYAITSRSIENTSLLIIYKIILTTGLVSMPVGFFISRFKKSWFVLTWYGHIWMGVFNFLFFLSWVEFFLYLFYQHENSVWVIYLAALISLWSLYKGLALPEVVQHKLNKPQLKGLKLVQISDLHVGMLHLNEKWLQKIVDKIKDLNPDIIAITGDLVEGKYKDISPKLALLTQLSSIPHKFYITGNHEYINGDGPWENLLSGFGFTTLHNENVCLTHLGAKILMAGVPDRMISRFIRNKNSLPDLALKTNEKVDYKILLAHQPSSVYDVKTESCDLILSGHTHGGQIFPFHFFVRLVQPVVGGFKTINKTLVFAHQGTGFWGPPMRLFSRSEIVVIEWQ